jgi:acyl-CoA thioesterase II
VQRSLVNLIPTDTPNRWVLPVTDDICAGSAERPFLFGGSGLAACVAAMSAAERRPLIWTTVQYLAYARPSEQLTVEVETLVRGSNTVQLRAEARVGDRLVLCAMGAAGERSGGDSRQIRWFGSPRSPEASRQVRNKHANPRGVSTQFEFRLSKGRFPSEGETFVRLSNGRMGLWVKLLNGAPIDASVLAIVSDYVSDALSDAVGRRVHASSIDNTLRFGAIQQTEWLYCDITVEQIHSGVGHGRMEIYTQEGQWMASSSTSMILRDPRDAETDIRSPTMV